MQPALANAGEISHQDGGNKMIKTGLRLITAAATIGVTMLVATPSHAVSGPTLNPDTASAALYNFTLYKNSDFSGCYSGANDVLWSGSLQGQSYGVLSCDTSVNNSASSMENNYSQYVYLYDATNCTGARYIAAPNSEDSTFSNNNFNDKASCIDY
jgi:hypothetical protein